MPSAGGRPDHAHRTTTRAGLLRPDHALKPPASRPSLPPQQFLCLPQPGQLPAAARVTGGLATGWSAPGWPQLSSIYFHVAVRGNPSTRPLATHWCHSLLETQGDPRPHTEDLGSGPPLPFLALELPLFTSLAFHVHRMGRDSALSTPQFVGRLQERWISLDFGAFIKVYLIYCS